jgi:EAL and modified HD-GYP domain-containing signal transduction protein
LQTDASVDEIYDIFQRESALSLQLIQFLTSTHPEYLHAATSIKEMIERMGKNQLTQWLLLIIYSKSGTMSTDTTNTYCVYAQERVSSMLKLLHLTTPNPAATLIEEARLVALLSLLEKLMKIPLENTLQGLIPSNDIKDALINNSGLLGRIYAAVLKLEDGDSVTAALLLKQYGVHQDQLV